MIGILGAVGGSVAKPGTVVAGNTGIASGTVGADPTGLPGGSTATGIVNGIVFYSLLLTLVGVVLSAGLWAVGSFSNNYTQSINGKKGFLISAAAALAIGAAFFLTTWFFGAGNGVG